MKREAIKHPQMMDLAARLEVDRGRAIGIVTLLLDWTADYAIQGNIGKHSDGVIARACGWGESAADLEISPSAFVEHLVGSGWLDRHGSARLLVHNWPTHCERWVLAKLKSSQLKFHPAYTGVAQVTKEREEYLAEPTVVETVVETVVATAPRDLSKPIQTKPNLSEPKARKRAGSFTVEDVKFPLELDTPEARAAAAVWLEHKRDKGSSYKNPDTFAALLSDWARAGPEAFAAAVEHSRKQNWSGLFAPHGNTKHGNHNSGSARKPYNPNPGLEYVEPAAEHHGGD